MRGWASYEAKRVWKYSASLGLCLLVFASAIPSGFALVDYKHFAGDYIDVSDSPSLELTSFSIEVSFRIMQAPLERGYLLSKGSPDSGNSLLDQNYALYLNPQSRVVGGFKALDGSYQYIYSPTITTSDWHHVKLTVESGLLRMLLDGKAVSSKSLESLPDTGLSEPLRIGANANGAPSKFFVGDIDFVKIVDRTLSARAYFNDFTGSSNTPEDCSDIPMDELHGAVFIDPILARFENDAGPSSPEGYVVNSMSYIKANGMNLVRVPFYWEAYVSWPAAFMDELELIAQAAAANNICVIFDNHHWYTSSYFANVDFGKTGKPKGFPSFLMQGYATTGDYNSAAGPFWSDFLANKIVVDGRSAWDLQADFLKKVVTRVDGYGSVLGYEILNEPHLFNSTQYDDLGRYHTYMAKEIRSVSDKKLVFNRETARGFQRVPSFEYKIVPQDVTGIIYGPHLYSAPVPGSSSEKQIENFKQWSSDWNVEILIGEWSGDTQDDTNTFVSALEDAGFGWTYYKWSPSKSADGEHLGNVLYQSNSTPMTLYLEYLVDAINEFY